MLRLKTIVTFNKHRIEKKGTTYRQTLLFSLPVAAFIIAGAIGVASPWLLVLLPIPFLVAWIVQRGLNDPVVLQDDEDEKRFAPLLSKINVVNQYSKIEEPLNDTDREILMTRQCDGHRYPEMYIHKLIANNQKIIYRGHITSKYVYDGEYLITIGKTTHFDIPAGTYQKLTLGDYVQITVAFACISGFKKPTFVLFCEIIRPSEDLERGG